MRGLQASLLVTAALGATSLAHAQGLGLGGTAKVGYGVTNRVTGTGGASGSISGLELGFEFPISGFGPIALYGAPSVLMGGRLVRGGDIDGDIYRFLVVARQNVPLTQAYLFAGAGISQARMRTPGFANRSGFATTLGGGVPMTGFIPGAQTSLELAMHQGNAPALRGFTVSLVARF
jgi:hypothetical protein